MKLPTNYGSENEEATFIRRVAEPDRPNARRRQKKRLAVAGAAVALVAASAAVGYATFRSVSIEAATIPAQQQMAANLEVPDFVDTMGDGYYPSFDQLDEDGDGVVTYLEYMKDLREVWDTDKENIANADLPQVVKDNLYDQLNDKITSDTACVKKAMVPTKKRMLSFDRKTIDSLYYMLEVFCFETPIEIPQKYLDMFPSPPAPVVETKAPAVEIPTPQGSETVTALSPPADGKEAVAIETPSGATKVEEVPVVETPEGPKAEVPTPGGGTAVVEVPEASQSALATEAPVIQQNEPAEVQTPQGMEKVTPEGPPSNGVQAVIVEDSNGGVKEENLPIVETSQGQPELEITAADGTTENVPLTKIDEFPAPTKQEEVPNTSVESEHTTKQTWSPTNPDENFNPNNENSMQTSEGYNNNEKSEEATEQFNPNNENSMQTSEGYNNNEKSEENNEQFNPNNENSMQTSEGYNNNEKSEENNEQFNPNNENSMQTSEGYNNNEKSEEATEQFNPNNENSMQTSEGYNNNEKSEENNEQFNPNNENSMQTSEGYNNNEKSEEATEQFNPNNENSMQTSEGYNNNEKSEENNEQFNPNNENSMQTSEGYNNNEKSEENNEQFNPNNENSMQTSEGYNNNEKSEENNEQFNPNNENSMQTSEGYNNNEKSEENNEQFNPNNENSMQTSEGYNNNEKSEEATEQFNPNNEQNSEQYMESTLTVETSQGLEKVTPEGPVVDGQVKAEVEEPNGLTKEEYLTVEDTPEGPMVEIETPQGMTAELPLAEEVGGNGDDENNYMTKVAFQNQIGQHFTGRIQSLKAQVVDEEGLTEKLQNWQTSLKDCIEEAANRFGYYGVYESPPYYKNAINWVDNECWKI
ncbi:hypothetical protein BBI17_002215 [Phytophthora kernoviae]|uniref:EF-hand domain-containing protein n=1 Tax=Phytophthora kernoviae TaxID=325452 RepID=A0A421ETS6_9STRA|nr:hypothetical protein BBI17_002215 [Phytophthora kernoviae]